MLLDKLILNSLIPVGCSDVSIEYSFCLWIHEEPQRFVCCAVFLVAFPLFAKRISQRNTFDKCVVFSSAYLLIHVLFYTKSVEQCYSRNRLGNRGTEKFSCHTNQLKVRPRLRQNSSIFHLHQTLKGILFVGGRICINESGCYSSIFQIEH